MASGCGQLGPVLFLDENTGLIELVAVRRQGKSGKSVKPCFIFYFPQTQQCRYCTQEQANWAQVLIVADSGTLSVSLLCSLRLKQHREYFTLLLHWSFKKNKRLFLAPFV